MAYQKTKKTKEPYLTAADKERIARVDVNPHLIDRKLKVQIVLKHPEITADICITVYGKDKNALKSSINEHLKIFQSADKKWKITEIIAA